MSKAYRIINVGKGVLNLTASNIEPVPAIVVGSGGGEDGDDIIDGGNANAIVIDNVINGGGA